MKSYSGAESLPFTSEHAAWHDTVSDPYCDGETSEYTSLRWTDLSTTDAIQFCGPRVLIPEKMLPFPLRKHLENRGIPLGFVLPMVRLFS